MGVRRRGEGGTLARNKKITSEDKCKLFIQFTKTKEKKTQHNQEIKKEIKKYTTKQFARGRKKEAITKKSGVENSFHMISISVATCH